MASFVIVVLFLTIYGIFRSSLSQQTMPTGMQTQCMLYPDMLTTLMTMVNQNKQKLAELEGEIEACKNKAKICYGEQLISGSQYRIPDSSLRVSSIWDNNHGPHRARLGTPRSGASRGAWSARSNNHDQWIQADLGEVMIVNGVITQGRNDVAQWVSSYKLFYSRNGLNMTEHYLLLTGNTDNRGTLISQCALMSSGVRHSLRTFHWS
ncbi:unnamed protein product [Owenia fusiformis]|uniref:Uncharacterized protein n=1 Tax=Owenia fusiformis TaxID=6347 RepID=A0A8J1TEF9_OWEFU|nr:unnamed protein product [Owenia fusiformis]